MSLTQLDVVDALAKMYEPKGTVDFVVTSLEALPSLIDKIPKKDKGLDQDDEDYMDEQKDTATEEKQGSKKHSKKRHSSKLRFREAVKMQLTAVAALIVPIKNVTMIYDTMLHKAKAAIRMTSPKEEFVALQKMSLRTQRK